MIFPFIGVFISLALWGTFFPVPGLIDPHESFVKRLSGAVGATAMVKGVYDLAEVISSAYTDPGHKDPAYVLLAGFESPGDHVDFPNTTETSLSVAIPLWEELEGRPVMNLVVRDGPRPKRFLSPTTSLLFALFVVVYTVGFLFFIRLLWHGLLSLSADEPGEVLERPTARPSKGVPGVVHYLVADRAPSLYEEVDALVEGTKLLEIVGSGPLVTAPASQGTAAQPAMQPALMVTIHREVEKAITRQHRRRELAAVSWLESCIAKELEGSPHDGTPETTFTIAAPDLSDAADSDALRSPRQWALVVRRPEHLAPTLVFQFAFALLASWERHTASAVPGSPGVRVDAEQESGEQVSSTPTGRRRKRPSQAKRRRAYRRLKAAQDELLDEAGEALSSTAYPGPWVHPASSPQSLGPNNGV